MNKKTTAIAAVVMGMIAVSGTVFAYGGGMGIENREAVQNAIETNDYNAFKEAMTNEITEEQFNQLVDMYQQRETMRNALENGDYEAWKLAVQEMEQTRLQNMLTEENFNRMMEMKQEMMNNGCSGIGTEFMGMGPMRGMKMGWEI